jgi:hypothetical protein
MVKTRRPSPVWGGCVETLLFIQYIKKRGRLQDESGDALPGDFHFASLFLRELGREPARSPLGVTFCVCFLRKVWTELGARWGAFFRFRKKARKANQGAPAPLDSMEGALMGALNQ